MESVLGSINDNLKELKALMVTVTQSQTHIATLQQGHLDQEARLRKVEQAQAAGKWTERVTWVLVSSGLAGLFSFLKFGGDK
jgi:hypothetical protein